MKHSLILIGMMILMSVYVNAELPSPEIIYYIETDNYGTIVRWGGTFDWGQTMTIGNNIRMCAGFYDIEGYPDANYTLERIDYDTGDALETVFEPDNEPYATDDYFYCYDSGDVSALNQSIRVIASNEGDTGTGYATLYNVVQKIECEVCEDASSDAFALDLMVSLLSVTCILAVLFTVINKFKGGD
jgi:hypothetical protein